MSTTRRSARLRCSSGSEQMTSTPSRRAELCCAVADQASRVASTGLTHSTTTESPSRNCSAASAYPVMYPAVPDASAIPLRISACSMVSIPHEGDLVTLRKRPRDRRLAGGRQTTDHDERCAGRWLGVVSGIHHPRNVRGVVDLRELAPYSAQFEIANSRASNARSSAADSIRAVARLGAVSTATIGTANASRPRTKTGKRNENTSSPCGAGAAAS